MISKMDLIGEIIVILFNTSPSYQGVARLQSSFSFFFSTKGLFSFVQTYFCHPIPPSQTPHKLLMHFRIPVILQFWFLSPSQSQLNLQLNLIQVGSDKVICLKSQIYGWHFSIAIVYKPRNDLQTQNGD